ncbi:MAG: hypothetical protein ACE3JN_05835 [Ectobacillus sp.]
MIRNERRRLQREKWDSRDPGLSVAREAARPRPPVVEKQQSSLKLVLSYIIAGHPAGDIAGSITVPAVLCFMDINGCAGF